MNPAVHLSLRWTLASIYHMIFILLSVAGLARKRRCGPTGSAPSLIVDPPLLDINIAGATPQDCLDYCRLILRGVPSDLLADASCCVPCASELDAFHCKKQDRLGSVHGVARASIQASPSIIAFERLGGLHLQSSLAMSLSLVYRVPWSRKIVWRTNTTSHKATHYQ